jgi:hypothetical protein
MCPAAHVAKAIGGVWTLAAVLLLVWSVRALYAWSRSTHHFSGPRNALLILLGAAAAAGVGGLLTLAGRSSGRLVLLVLSLLTLLYVAAYLLMGGFDDTGTTYALRVLAFGAISLATLLLQSRLI